MWFRGTFSWSREYPGLEFIPSVGEGPWATEMPTPRRG
jgi:hypothetical protein